jgi:pimeloyl-ACP methyl ester carboxylesterase
MKDTGVVMDEASSRFVDTLSIERLLTEKLEKVHHFPKIRFDEIEGNLFSDFASISCNAEISTNDQTGVMQFVSPVCCDYPQNRFVPVISCDVNNARATIILVHGLFEENRNIYSFLIKGLNYAGYNVKMLTLPFHYERTPNDSLFSGEFFWSADILRTRKAFKQAVYEQYQLYTWLTLTLDHPVFIASFSMGAGVSLMLATLFPDIKGLFVINPASALSNIVWDSPLCRTIKEDYFQAGYTIENLKKMYALFEPISADKIVTDSENICMVYAQYDMVTEQKQYLRLIEKWKLKNILSYKAGHLNTLRVPRLADDIASFFNARINNHFALPFQSDGVKPLAVPNEKSQLRPGEHLALNPD